MAQGYIDPESGTWIYDQDDAQQPVRDLLNRLAASVRDVVITVKARLSALENQSAAVKPGSTGLNGYAVDPATTVLQVSDVIMLSMVLTKASGGITAVEALQLPAGTYPRSTITEQAVASVGGSAGPVTVTITPQGRVRVWTASTANTRLDLSTFWLRA